MSSFSRPWRDSYFAGTFTRQFLPGYFHSRLAALGHSRGRLCHMSMGAIFIRLLAVLRVGVTFVPLGCNAVLVEMQNGVMSDFYVIEPKAVIVASAVPGGTLYFAATFTRQFLPGYFHSRLAALPVMPLSVYVPDPAAMLEDRPFRAAAALHGRKVMGHSALERHRCPQPFDTF